MCGPLLLLRGHLGPWKYQIRLELDTRHQVHHFCLQWFLVLDGCQSMSHCCCRSIVVDECRSMGGLLCRSDGFYLFFPKQFLIDDDLLHREFACWVVPHLWNLHVVHLRRKPLFLLHSFHDGDYLPNCQSSSLLLSHGQLLCWSMVGGNVGRCSFTVSPMRLSIDRWWACCVDWWTFLFQEEWCRSIFSSLMIALYSVARSSS